MEVAAHVNVPVNWKRTSVTKVRSNCSPSRKIMIFDNIYMRFFDRRSSGGTVLRWRNLCSSF